MCVDQTFSPGTSSELSKRYYCHFSLITIICSLNVLHISINEAYSKYANKLLHTHVQVMVHSTSHVTVSSKHPLLQVMAIECLAKTTIVLNHLFSLILTLSMSTGNWA